MGMRTILAGASLVAASVIVTGAPVLSQPLQIYAEPEDLPAGEAREDTFYNCSACHSFQVVARQGMTRELWDNTLTVMVERHGMWELDPEDRERILNYLAEAFPQATPEGEGGGGWVSPFAPK